MSVDPSRAHETVKLLESCIDLDAETSQSLPPLRSLVATAILNASDGRLTAKEACYWISERHPYYQLSTNTRQWEVKSISTQEKPFVVLEQADVQGWHYYSIAPGADVENEEILAEDIETAVFGVARVAVHSGQAKLIDL